MDTNFKWRTDFAKNIFHYRYAQGPDDTWPKLCHRLVEDVCGSRNSSEPLNLLSKEDRDQLAHYMIQMKFIPGGRYLYYAGRPKHFFNNCFSHIAEEDTREEWARLVQDVTACLMSGGGVGIIYDILRPKGYTLKNTGGTSSGPLALMKMINEIGRYVIQGGSRRCLDEKAPITMSDGSKRPICDVVPGDYVSTRNGPRKVLRKFNQGIQEVFRIRTDHGDLFSTANHRWFGADLNRNRGWQYTRDLANGSKIYRYYMPKTGGDAYNKKWMYTLGYYLGNGCAYSSNRTHEITFQLPDKHISQEQIDCIQDGMSDFGMNMCKRKGHGACTELRFRGRKWVPYFQKYKKPNTEFRIPNEANAADADSLSAFFAGWFDSDGDIRKDNIIRLSNKYKDTCVQACRLLRKLGLETKLHTVAGIYTIYLSAKQYNLFLDTIGKYSFKFKHLKHTDHWLLFSTVESIESAGYRQTYDIEVEDHEFIAYDHISHNSALFAGLNWRHEDIQDFLVCKDYPKEYRSFKENDLDFPLPMDMTNVSIGWDTDFADEYLQDLSTPVPELWTSSVKKMMKTGEPGHCYNFYEHEYEIGRNACGEFISDVDSNVCNLGSVNFANIESIDELKDVCNLASKFLYCGTIRGEVPTDKIKKVRDQRRQLGLGLMGIHEWLLARGQRYESTDELANWLEVWRQGSQSGSNEVANKFGLPQPYKYRAVAPAGTIGILASTTTGIEPMFAVAYKRRFIVGSNTHKYQYVIDATAQRIIDKYGIEPDSIETATELSKDLERRLSFQAFIQHYVDMGISSTINMPAWGTEFNNEDRVPEVSDLLRKYALDLRGITMYPDGGRGGQPLNPVQYDEAKKHEGVVYDEEENVCSGGICGI